MAKFAIYQYLFDKILEPTQLDMYYDYTNVDVEESWKNKQEIFSSLFSENPHTDNPDLYKLHFVSVKAGELTSEIMHIPNAPNIIVIRIASKKRQKLEEELGSKQVSYGPSAIIIIDNRDGIQRVAIEERKNAFSLNSIQDMFIKAVNECLKYKKLRLSLNPKRYSKQAWILIGKHKDKINTMSFSFMHPNLPDITKMMNELDDIYSTAEEFNANTTLTLQALPEQTLHIDVSSLRFISMVNVCAATGQPIVFYTTDKKKYECFVSTNNDDIVKELLNVKREDLNEFTHNQRMKESTKQSIVAFVNNLKLYY